MQNYCFIYNKVFSSKHKCGQDGWVVGLKIILQKTESDVKICFNLILHCNLGIQLFAILMTNICF